MAPVMSKAPIQPIASYDTAFDLERELTLSMEAEADAPVVPAPVAAAPVVAPVMPAPVVPAPVVSASVSARPVAPAEPRAGPPIPSRRISAVRPRSPVACRGRAGPSRPRFRRPCSSGCGRAGCGRSCCRRCAGRAELRARFRSCRLRARSCRSGDGDRGCPAGTACRAPVAAAPAPVYQPAPSAPVEDFFEELPEIELPFDPSMIAMPMTLRRRPRISMFRNCRSSKKAGRSSTRATTTSISMRKWRISSRTSRAPRRALPRLPAPRPPRRFLPSRLGRPPAPMPLRRRPLCAAGASAGSRSPGCAGRAPCGNAGFRRARARAAAGGR